MSHRIAVMLLGLTLACGAGATDSVHDRTTWIGGNIVISDPVQGPLTAIGGNVTVSAPVTGRVRLAGGKVTIASGATISGDVAVAGGDVTIQGSIDGPLRAAGGKVRIDGPVTGDASVAAGTLELGPDARIQGKLTFRGEDLRRDPAAQVTGGVERTAGYRDWHGGHWHQRTAGERFLHGWLWTAGLMVLAALIAAALPGPSNRMARELREHPGTTTLLGIVSLITIPVAAVLLMITIIGIPIGVLAIMGYVALLLVGYVWLAVVVGGMLLDRVKPQTTAVAGWRAGMAVLAMLLIALLVRVPYVGGLAHLVALVLGVGMIVATVFGANKPGAQLSNEGGTLSVVFLLDCDNTLLDNDRVQEDLRRYLTKEFGAASCTRYWAIFEELRQELGYADYLGALQRYRLDDLHDPKVLLVSAYLVDYPFADRLYPGALDAIAHLRRLGPTVILSDGDVAFQPRKIQRSGLWDAVDGRVLIYIHKEQMLDDVAERYPAQRYVMVDDKLHVLAAMKAIWRERLTTIFVRQGHYALDPAIVSTSPPADVTVERIGELAQFDFQEVA